MSKNNDIERTLYIKKIDALSKQCNQLQNKLELESRFKKEYKALVSDYKSKLKALDRLKTEYETLVNELALIVHQTKK